MFCFCFPGASRHARHNKWKPVDTKEMKIYFAHLILMGCVKKPNLESYWCKERMTSVPFFGTYMSRNRFQAINSNLHLADDQNNPQRGTAGHDRLHKVRFLIDLLREKFKLYFVPSRDLSIDEGGMPFHGRVVFRVFNPSKPAKYHIKLYVLSHAQSGYILNFEIYDGKTKPVQVSTYPNPAVTTETVLRLLKDAGCLDKGHHVYMDNYYTGVDLFEELKSRDTLACGTVRSNRSRLPAACKSVPKKGKKALKRGEAVWRRSEPREGEEQGDLLAVRIQDKRLVFMLTTIHAAEEVHVKDTYQGEAVWKPTCIDDYNQKMRGVDLADQLLSYYTPLRKCMKWSTKMHHHLFNMAILNAFMLYKTANPNASVSHYEFRIAVIESLIREGDLEVLVHANTHMPQKLPATRSKPTPYRRCVMCQAEGRNRKNYTKVWCAACKIPLCITNDCFAKYHKEKAAEGQPPQSP